MAQSERNSHSKTRYNKNMKCVLKSDLLLFRSREIYNQLRVKYSVAYMDGIHTIIDNMSPFQFPEGTTASGKHFAYVFDLV